MTSLCERKKKTTIRPCGSSVTAPIHCTLRMDCYMLCVEKWIKPALTLHETQGYLCPPSKSIL